LGLPGGAVLTQEVCRDIENQSIEEMNALGETPPPEDSLRAAPELSADGRLSGPWDARRIRLWIAVTMTLSAAVPMAVAAAVYALAATGQLVHEQVHAALEISGGCVAMGLALLLWLRLRDPGAARHYLWVIASLLSMGVLDVVHGGLDFGVAWSWTRHFGTLVGGVFFACVWLPVTPKIWRWRKAVPLGALVLSAVISALACGLPESFPAPWTAAGYTFSPKLVNGLGGVGFLVASVFFVRRFSRTAELGELIFSGQTMLFAVSGLLFSVSHVWGAEWWLWHALRWLAYLVVAGAGYQTVKRMHDQLLRRKTELESEVDQRVRALRSSEERFREVFQHAATGIAIFDAHGRFLQCNPAYLAMVGYSQEDLWTMDISMVLHPEDREENFRLFQRLLAGDISFYRLENRYQRKQGGALWAEKYVSALRHEAGKPTQLFALVTDITERRQAEQQIRRSEQHLRRVLDNLFAFVGVTTPDGTLIEANRAPLEAARIAAKEVLGRKFWDTYWWNYSPKVQQQLREACERASRGEVVRYDVQVRMASDSRMWIDFQVAPLCDEEGGVTHLIPSAMDITARKEFEAALRDAHAQLAEHAVQLERLIEQRTAKLKESIGDLEQFSYSIAHDLRAPLRAMGAFSSMLLEEYQDKLDEDGVGYLRRIASAAERMDALIRDVLTYSRVVRSEAVLTNVGLDHLLREIVEQYPQFGSDHADVHIEHPLLPVLGNAALLTQCISNLLGNAIKFVAQGVKPRVRVWTELRDGWVRLSVQDNGIGIEDRHLERIWRMFERLHNNLTYEGTGIGLAIVKKAVERIGGRVGATSEFGHGSTFWIELRPPKSGSQGVQI
jgi:PAS domain S-box-containing protein